jgi:c(7)-type cytochrome triheme protein
VSRKGRRRGLGILLVCAFPVAYTWGEYADVILNNRSEAEGVSPVIFPHWFHRIRFQCSVCHVELGIKMKAGTSDMRMDAITNGKYCGACHDGQTAWTVDNCDLCHSGKPGLATGVQGGHQTLGPGIY